MLKLLVLIYSGGFLVAEAAVQFPSKEGGHQIIGVIAMDVPYLGKAPHSCKPTAIP